MSRTESLSDVCSELKITCEARYGANRTTPDDFAGHNPYRVTLRKGRRQLSTDFFTGSGWRKEPGAADVLSCLCSDAYAGEQTFEDFCSDMGMDQDSRKAERIWRACKAIAPKLRRFLGEDFDRCANADH